MKITQQNPLILGGLTINPHIIAAIPGLLHSNSTANQKINRRMDQIQGKNLKKCLPILKGIYSTSGLGCRRSMMSSKVPSYCRGTSPPGSSHMDLLATARAPSTSPTSRRRCGPAWRARAWRCHGRNLPHRKAPPSMAGTLGPPRTLGPTYGSTARTLGPA